MSEHGAMELKSARAPRRLTRRAQLRGAGLTGLAVGAAACGVPGQGQAPATLVKAPAEITWTFWATPENRRFFDTMGQTFEQRFPQVKVQLSQVEGSYNEKIITMVTGGTPPDAMCILRPQACDWAVKGISLALDPYLQRGGFKESEYFPTTVAPWRYGGKLYALPREVDSWLLWYNRKLFDEAGIKPPDETWTWDTMVDRAQRLTNRDAARPQWGLSPSAFTHKLWVGLALQNGSKLYDREALPTRLLMNTPAVTDSLQWMADLRHKFRAVPTDDEIQQNSNARTLFQRGQLAMFWAESTNSANFATAIQDFQYDVAVPVKGKQLGTWLGGACYGVARASTKLDAAAQFMLHASGPEGQRLMVEQQFGTPAWRPAAESDAFLKKTPPNNKRAYRQALDFGAGPPMMPLFADFERAVATELNQTWSGQRLAKDSVAAAWPQVEEIMRQVQEMAKQMPQ